MTNDWLVIIRFKNMPEDADQDSMAIFLLALLESTENVEYDVIEMRRENR